MEYLATGGKDGGRNGVGPVLRHGGASDHEQVAAGRQSFAQGLRHGIPPMGATLHQAKVAAQVLDAAPAAGDGSGVVSCRIAGLFGDDQRHALLPVGQERERPPPPSLLGAALDDCLADSQRQDLHGGNHRTGAHRGKGLQGRHGDGFVDLVDPVDELSRNADQAALRGVEIASASVGFTGKDALAFEQGSDCGSGGVFSEIAGGEARAIDHGMAGRSQQLTVGAGQAAAFPEYASWQAQAVRQQQAFAFRRWKFAEDHPAAPR